MSDGSYTWLLRNVSTSPNRTQVMVEMDGVGIFCVSECLKRTLCITAFFLVVNEVGPQETGPWKIYRSISSLVDQYFLLCSMMSDEVNMATSERELRSNIC